MKIPFFYHTATSPDAQINYSVPMNMTLYENRTFLLTTALKELENSL